MIKELIYNYWDAELPKVIERDIEVDVESDLINDFVGPRRAGKTYLMFGTIKKLLKKIDKKATVYLNFENRRLYPLSPEMFNQVISFLYQENLFEKHKRIYLFFDEIQRVEGWERFVRSIYDEFKGKVKIFVSGSSSNLLSKEYGKLLTGRHLTVSVFTLSFKEFLEFKGFKLDILSEKKIAQIKKLFEEYLAFGGFPEVVLSTKSEKENLLNQLFLDIISRDILARVGIRKERFLEDFAYYLCGNISNLLSFNKMRNHFSNRGIKISVPTLESYLNLTENAFLFFETLIFSYSIKSQLQYPRKIYCLDNGLANLIGFKFSENIGRIYENMVAIEFYRKYFNVPGAEIFYWKDPKNREVDFVIKNKLNIRQLVQVCYKLDDEIRDREIDSLIRASQELKCDNLMIISSDYEGNIKLKDKKLKFIPLWKWLIQ